LREHSLQAWQAVGAGQANPLAELLADDARLLAFLSADEIRQAMDSTAYVGSAPAWARAMASAVRAALAEPVD
ncbi:MAG: adenylosuccinate lyase, partial [Anaerolineae bacterium]|nr:adenylosuccinate lyase [Anaerolineae bacterium]